MFELLRTTTGCGVDEFCTDVGVKKTLRYVGYAIFIVKIILPLIIIILASIDLGKALGNPDEEIKNSIFTILKRIMSALIIYFIPTILNFAISDVFDFKKVKDCAECMFKPFECEISDNPIQCITKVDSINIKDCENGITLSIGNRKNLYIQYQPADAENRVVSFKSSSKNVSVNKFGIIKAEKEGTSTITATLKDDDSIKATCKIKVKKYEPKEPSVTPEASLIGNYKYFAQCDFQWQQYSFCGYSPCSTACGAFSLTMVVNNLTNKNVQPNEVMNFICQNDKSSRGYTSDNMFNAGAIPSMKFQSKYGIKSTNITGRAGRASAATLNKLDDRLKKGEMLVCLVPGHFITMIGDSKGNVTILDPGSSKTNKTFSNVKDAYNFIFDHWQGINGSGGGAIWAYSKAK